MRYGDGAGWNAYAPRFAGADAGPLRAWCAGVVAGAFGPRAGYGVAGADFKSSLAAANLGEPRFRLAGT